MKKVSAAFILIFSMFIGASIAEADSSNQLIIINKSTNRLAFFEGGKLVNVFKVATGRSMSLTPEGTFKIVNKIKNRPYYTGHIPGGDPRNPLGDRWLGLDARGTYGTTYAIHGNSNPASIGTYASSGCVRMYDEEVRWLFDQVELYTPVVITQSSQSFETLALSYNYLMYSQVESFSVSENSPQPLETSITVSANATKRDSLYRFEVFDGSEWTTLQDFSAANKIDWKPADAGSYKLKVQVKSSESKKPFDDEKVIPYDIFIPAAIESVDLKKESPQPVNSTINIKTKTNSEENNKIKFSIFDGENWITLQEFSAKTSVTWKPTAPGTYKIKVQTKHKISTAEFDQEKVLDYTVYVPASFNSLTTDVAGPQPTDKIINLVALSNDDTANVFKFLINNGDGWVTLQNYSPTNNLSWKPKSDGNYKVKVQVKHSLSREKFDAEQEMDIIIFEPATLKEVHTYKSNLLPVKSNINLSAIAKNNKNIEYRFSVFNGSDWVVLQNYSTTSKLRWKPTKAGIYKLKIELKNSYSKKEFDDVEEVSYIIYQAIPFVAVLPGQNTIKSKKTKLKNGSSTYKFKT